MKNCLICTHIDIYEDGEDLGYEGSYNGTAYDCKLRCTKKFIPKADIETDCNRFKAQVIECRVCKAKAPRTNLNTLFTCGKIECEKTLEKWCDEGYEL